MKKNLLMLLFAVGLFYSSSAYITLYGQYRKINNNSFFCAMISTQFCARVQEPPEEVFKWWPGPQHITIFSPNGSVLDQFDVESTEISKRPDGTLVTYKLVELP